MNNFYYQIPTGVFFGKGQIEHLGKSVLKYGRKVLLVYCGDTILPTGLYQTIQTIFDQNDIKSFELSGVEPNPKIESVRKGVQLCRQNNVEVVLAVGGGSAIDCAKMISAGAKYNGDAWDLVQNGSLIQEMLPLITVVTIAATGSEMDRYAVISDRNTNEKIGVFSPLFYPVVSILDPEYTFTVPKNQTAAGTADIMSHVIESYFNNTAGAYIQARISEGLLKTCIHYGPIAYREPENYEARANLMWASTLANDGLTWRGIDVVISAHAMGHQLSAYFDITHGVALAIITPHWMKHILNDRTVSKFVDFSVNVWGVDPNPDSFEIANKGIDLLKEFFASLGIPSTLKEVGVTDEYLGVMAEKASVGLENAFSPLTGKDVLAIFKASM